MASVSAPDLRAATTARLTSDAATDAMPRHFAGPLRHGATRWLALAAVALGLSLVVALAWIIVGPPGDDRVLIALILGVAAVVAAVGSLVILRALAALRRLRDAVAEQDEERELPALIARPDEIGDLARAFQRLTRRLGQRSAALAGEADEIARLQRDLGQFADAASHHLQQPLRMIAGNLDLLASRRRELDDREIDDLIAFAAKGAAEMKRLVAELDAYIRASRRPLVKKVVDMRTVADRVAASLAPRIAEAGAALSIGALPEVEADEGQCERLLAGLLGAALDAGARIEIAAEQGNATWDFAVTADGVATETASFDRSFDILGPQGGLERTTGPSLAVCRRIVERHGGSLRIDAPAGGRIAFRFALPAIPAAVSGNRSRAGGRQ